MPELIDYEAVLADLEAKRSAFDAAITGIRQILNLGAQNGLVGIAPRQVEAGEIPSDAFFGLGIGEGAKKYLGIVKRKQSAVQIADALDKGGLQHTSKFFPNTVRTALMRLAADGEVVQVGKEWGLAEWYPGRKKGGRGVAPRVADTIPVDHNEPADED